MSIKGNTVGTPMPRTDWNQTDPTKADYLKGRDDLSQSIQDAIDDHTTTVLAQKFIDVTLYATDPNNDGNIVLQYGGVVEGGGTGGTIPGGNTGGLSAAEVQDMIDASLEGFEGGKGEPGKDGVDGKDGEDGYTPVRGTDYWTEEDKAEIKSYVDEAILGGAW